MNPAMWPLIIKIAFFFLENFIDNKGQDQESRKIFLDLAGKLRQKGVDGIKSRYESEDQIGAGNDAWDKREKPPEPKQE